MEYEEKLKKDMGRILVDLKNTKDIGETGKNTNIHPSKIQNWLNDGKVFHQEPHYSFYLDYQKIMGNPINDYGFR